LTSSRYSSDWPWAPAPPSAPSAPLAPPPCCCSCIAAWRALAATPSRCARRSSSRRFSCEAQGAGGRVAGVGLGDGAARRNACKHALADPAGPQLHPLGMAWHGRHEAPPGIRHFLGHKATSPRRHPPQHIRHLQANRVQRNRRPWPHRQLPEAPSAARHTLSQALHPAPLPPSDCRRGLGLCPFLVPLPAPTCCRSLAACSSACLSSSMRRSPSTTPARPERIIPHIWGIQGICHICAQLNLLRAGSALLFESNGLASGCGYATSAEPSPSVAAVGSSETSQARAFSRCATPRRAALKQTTQVYRAHCYGLQPAAQ
jgi:hypothetical protein